MIKGNLKSLDKNLDKDIYTILNKLKDEELLSKELGLHKLDGEDFFVRTEYETKDYEGSFIEAHKKYIDIHVTLCGSEVIEVEDIRKLQVEKEYDEENDCLILSGKTSQKIILEKNDFLVCYPKDAHRVGIKNIDKEKIKKIVVKLLV
ncbi:YhcH/YjgK/YiaL family protein [Fusobacteria bacterium ZRK30]|nr:YhcH/YjgK/YiaL family protein [Fusobacteria bacterium ZRK30]